MTTSENKTIKIILLDTFYIVEDVPGTITNFDAVDKKLTFSIGAKVAMHLVVADGAELVEKMIGKKATLTRAGEIIEQVVAVKEGKPRSSTAGCAPGTKLNSLLG